MLLFTRRFGIASGFPLPTPKVLTHVVRHRPTHKAPVLAGSRSLLAQGPSLGLISAY